MVAHVTGHFVNGSDEPVCWTLEYRVHGQPQYIKHDEEVTVDAGMTKSTSFAFSTDLVDTAYPLRVHASLPHFPSHLISWHGQSDASFRIVAENGMGHHNYDSLRHAATTSTSLDDEPFYKSILFYVLAGLSFLLIVACGILTFYLVRSHKKLSDYDASTERAWQLNQPENVSYNPYSKYRGHSPW